MSLRVLFMVVGAYFMLPFLISQHLAEENAKVTTLQVASEKLARAIKVLGQ